MNNKISVIIPVYKVEPYLRKCVDSVLTQTHRNLEVILVDDGSPDNSGIICDEYARKDSRVKVVHKENGGLSDARNVGMDVAKGDYLMFVDSDDILPEDAVKTLLELAVRENAELVIGNHNRFEDVPVHTPERLGCEVLSAQEAMSDMFRNGCAAWARIYRRELHEGIHFPVGEINEDEAIVLQILERCKKVVKTETIVYHYRCRPESITTASFSIKKVDWYRHCVNNLAWVKEKEPELTPLAIDRLGSCIVFLLHQMAICDYTDDDLVAMLRSDLRKGYCTYQKHYLSGKTEKMRMWFLNYFPYCIYRAVITLKRRLFENGKV